MFHSRVGSVEAVGIILLVAIFSLVQSAFVTQNPSGGPNCTTTGPVTGRSVFCCDGECQDRVTYITHPAGQCAGFENCWLDTGNSNNLGQCPGNNNAATDCHGGFTFENGDGYCCCGPSNCQWQGLNYTFTCCPCPTGYVPGYTQQGTDRANQQCVKCDSQLEQLSHNNGSHCTPTCVLPYNNMPCTDGQRFGGCRHITCIPPSTNTSTCSMGGDGDCKMNAQGLALLLDYEKCCANPYFAKPHRQDMTIGCGHDCPANGDCDSYPQPMTTDAMLQLLGQDLANYVTPISGWRNIGCLNTNQFSALADYAYHHGIGRARGCFRGMIANGGADGVCDQIRDCYDDSRKSDGTIAREQAEQQLCNMPPPANSMGCGSTCSHPST